MANLDAQLTAWEKAVAKKVKLSNSEKERINHAGAEVFARKLSEDTRKKHYSNRPHASDYKHLADSITVENQSVDGDKNGNVSVGFGDKAYIARFLNDGTIYIKGDHFVERLREDAKTAVKQAQAAEWHKMMKGD